MQISEKALLTLQRSAWTPQELQKHRKDAKSKPSYLPQTTTKRFKRPQNTWIGYSNLSISQNGSSSVRFRTGNVERQKGYSQGAAAPGTIIHSRSSNIRHIKSNTLVQPKDL